ncbi:hypothetical protein V8F06_014814 [Rhypophila decipiens]
MGVFSKIKNTWKKVKGKEKDEGGDRSSLSTPPSTGPTPAPVPSVPQPLNTAPTSPSPQSTVSNATVSPARTDIDLWACAYKEVEEREFQLIADYNKHLGSLHGEATAGASLSTTLSIESIESIVNTLLEDRKKKQWRVSLQGKDVLIREQVERLVKFFLWSDKIIKEVVSAQPYAGLAWSGVSLLLPLLTSGTTQNAAMLEGFNSVGNFQLYWHICEKTLLGPPHRLDYQQLHKPLANLYSYMIEYQARVVCHLSKAQLSRALHDATNSDDWISMIRKIETLDKSCRDCIGPLLAGKIQEQSHSQLQAMQENRDILKEILQIVKENGRQPQEIYEDQKQRELLQDLVSTFGDHSNDKTRTENMGSGVEDYKDFNPIRVEKTCEWFFDDDRFLKWRGSATSSLLWVSAGPGCGKSVLSRALIDEKLLSNNVTTSKICHFFFKEGDERRMASTNALCAILHQLFIQDTSKRLIQNALTSHNNHRKTLTGNFSELWRILEDCAKSPDAGEIVCLLDALDECNNGSRKQLLHQINDFYQRQDQMAKSPSKLKFLITSRPYDNLERSFSRFSDTAKYMHFDGDDKSDEINRDINRVIDAKIPEIAAGFTDEDQRAISRRLKDMGHRTYLWLYLILDIITENQAGYSRRHDVEDLLSDLPSEVSGAYEKILGRTKYQVQTETLLYIVLAAARPLTLNETNIALTLALGKQPFTSEATLGRALWPTDNFRSIITNLCGLFISVHDSKLSFIHQTAREFLMHKERQGTWQGRLNLSRAHSLLSRSCLQYLLLLDINSAAKNEDHPFLSYAASNWAFHFRSQNTELSEKDGKDARQLCRVSGPRAQLWCQFLEREDWNLRRENWASWSDLTFASYLGLATITNDILTNEHIDVNARGGHYRTAIYAAVSRGYLNVIRVLLEPSHKVKITEEVVKAAAGNKSNGKEMMALLLDQRGTEVKITEEVVKAAAENQSSGNGTEVKIRRLKRWLKQQLRTRAVARR